MAVRLSCRGIVGTREHGDREGFLEDMASELSKGKRLAVSW